MIALFFKNQLMITYFLGLLLAAYVSPAADTAFVAYRQTIPGTTVTFTMVPVKGGSFTMGSPAGESGRKPDEGPALTVTVDSFWMEAHEVTYDEYVLFADEQADKGPTPDGVTRPSPPYIDFTLGMGKAGGFPANSMSQHAATMYCKWLYRKTGIFYRLPTEAEWEYAARAGSATAYPFSENAAGLGSYAWYAANSDNKYHKVMEKQPNAWGLYDMLGNVAEWTMDQYREDYFEAIQADTHNPWLQPAKRHPITLKGGMFRDEAAALRCAARLKPDLKWNARDPQIPRSKWWNTDAPFIGFRVVRPVKQPTPEAIETFFTQLLSIK